MMVMAPNGADGSAGDWSDIIIRIMAATVVVAMVMMVQS